MKLTHVRLLVKNYRACFRFYHKIMGFELVWGEEAGAYAEFRTEGGALIALNRPEVMQGLVRGGGSESDRAVLILAVDNLERTVSELKQKGAQFTADIQDRPDWGVRTAHLRDPAGNLLELNTPLEGAP